MNLIQYSFEVEKDDFDRAGEASSKIKKIMRQLGIDATIIRRVAIAAYEAEINIVIHSFGGKIEFKIDSDSISVTAADKGPGIPDIELAMQEGYSTATENVREMGFGAGMGLPNIKKCSDKFDIKSDLGKGTTINVIFYL